MINVCHYKRTGDSSTTRWQRYSSGDGSSITSSSLFLSNSCPRAPPRSLECSNSRRSRVTTGDIQEPERLDGLLDQDPAQSAVNLAMKEIVVVDLLIRKVTGELGRSICHSSIAVG
jgi:hypothetical protein